ncbi:Rrf2 family transcriptional regulator [Bacillus sp. BRMEA1]|uniref:RrF2 family transcriptional regulator n=1 Tax=Neobacillus endophyticus TaxID=2738405 RepID=UPI00156701C0|nr:Rrf2 family transcriptional regulator [Neobacillus endophyticus]NRD78509.1 Rrf2 family transcriptional regulator [Neobacillus endophyticus]
MHLKKKKHTVTPSAFGLAIQGLVLLSMSDNVLSSKEIANMMESGTTFMRRVMSQLVRANLVEAREGRDGGYLLAKPANSITLADVYRALQMSNPLGSGMVDSTLDCERGASVRSLFQELSSQVEESTLHVFKQYTIERIAAEVFKNEV